LSPYNFGRKELPKDLKLELKSKSNSLSLGTIPFRLIPPLWHDIVSIEKPELANGGARMEHLKAVAILLIANMMATALLTEVEQPMKLVLYIGLGIGDFLAIIYIIGGIGKGGD
jgi:hypothetical protein